MALSKDSVELLDYLNIIRLKGQLLMLPNTKMVEKYQTEEMYATFLNTVHIMNTLDSAFLLFDYESTRKIKEVLAAYRFSYCDSDYHVLCNEIIGFLNELKDESQIIQNIKKDSYLDYHQELRRIEFRKEETFLDAFRYDAFVLDQLQNNHWQYLDEVLFLSSINYFVEIIPELFDEKSIMQRAEEKLTDLSFHHRFFKRNIRNFAEITIDHFQKVKKN